jgi:hypothetical protein
MEEYFKVYDELREQYPLYMILKQINRRWRIEVYGRKMAENGSDAVIITAEHDSRGQAFIDAHKLLEGSRARIEDLKNNLSEIHRAFMNHF